ncbi:glycosyltransferase family 61 protein [Arthrobacter sp. UYCu512]|uniref:glycosyltransferase family 61 protein n=1 Tax=Arthrobacter sp. UYCu512 TaxID=3156338 RepID=UPI003392D6D5
MQAIEHHTASMRSCGQIELLDICAEPHQELPVWKEYLPNGECFGVYSRNADTIAFEIPKNTSVSAGFGEKFWLQIATERSPHLVLSDGKLSHYHQLELFTHLFPAMQPGGVFVLECNASATGNVMLALLAQIAESGFSSSSSLTAKTDFVGYCARNIVAIEYSEAAVIVRKRFFEQRKLTTAPLRDLAKSFKQLDSPGLYSRVTPKIYGSADIERRTSSLINTFSDTPHPGAEVGRLENVTVVDGGVVVTSDGRIVEESFINARHTSKRGPFFRVGKGNLYVSERPISAQASLLGDSYAIIKQTWDSNFGHWIVDTLPRVANIVEEFPGAALRFILNGAAPSAIKDLHAASLGLFGINADQIDFVDRRPTFVREALYATPMTIPPFIKSPRTVSILEQLVDRCSPQVRALYASPRKIYLTRNRYPRRNLLNESEILPEIEEAGYEVIAPEHLSLEEQICLFASASHVIGNMGAAFSSLVFSPQAVKVLALATEQMVHDYFYDIVCHKSGEYWALQGRASHPDAGIGSDFSINTDDFSRIFAEFDR